MTELARTPPALRRLFRLVDLGPKPHTMLRGSAWIFGRRNEVERSRPRCKLSSTRVWISFGLMP